MSNAQLFPVIVKLNYSGGWIPATTLTILSALFTDILCFAARPHFVSDNAPPPFPGGGVFKKIFFYFYRYVYIITNCVLFICFLVKICLIVKVVEILVFFFSQQKHIVGGIVSLDLTQYFIKVHFGVKKILFNKQRRCGLCRPNYFVVHPSVITWLVAQGGCNLMLQIPWNPVVFLS